MQVQFLFEFRLSDQRNLNQLVFGSLEVGEHSKIFESIDRHVLRFIHYQDDVAAFLVFFDQCMMHLGHHVEYILVFRRDVEFIAECSHQIGKRDVRIEQVNGFKAFGIYAFQVRAQYSCFPDSHLADYGNNAFSFGNAVNENSERFLVTRTEE